VIRDYDNLSPARIEEYKDNGRLCIVTVVDGGVEIAVDLLDVIAWVRANMPELLGEVAKDVCVSR
jgi:hypothetical protein